jgi:hypothetical protein
MRLTMVICKYKEGKNEEYRAYPQFADRTPYSPFKSQSYSLFNKSVKSFKSVSRIHDAKTYRHNRLKRLKDSLRILLTTTSSYHLIGHECVSCS